MLSTRSLSTRRPPVRRGWRQRRGWRTTRSTAGRPWQRSRFTWRSQIRERLVEPNSSLGKGFQYLLNPWETRTQFLRVPGAALDNNTVEVRFVDPKPNLFQVWGMDPEPQKGSDLWLENLILV